MAIRVPLEDLGGVVDAGAAQVIYAGPNRLSAVKNQFWSQDSPGVIGASEDFDFFGRSLATGDFNGDGKDDLAIGVSSEDVGDVVDAGAVHVLYGSALRLSAAGNELLTRNSVAGDAAGTEDRFGRALSFGDYNGDNKADLAIGTPGQTVAGLVEAGAVRVVYGRTGDLDIVPLPQLWTQIDVGIFGDSGDEFGLTL